MTYDPEAVYDDEWLNDTLYDTAVGAVLGGLGGGVGAVTGRTAAENAPKIAVEQRPAAKQESPAPNVEAEQKPVRVGRVTTIQRPYTGPTPVQTRTSGIVPEVPAASVENARNNIQLAEREAQANAGKGFKTFLMKIFQQTFKRSPGVPVSGMTFRGKPYLVEIGNNVPKKIVSSQEVSAEKLALLDMLPEVVRAGEYVGSGEYVQHSGKRKLTVRFDYFETETNIAGQPYVVSFDAEVFPNQNNYRTHKINKIELSPASNADLGPNAQRK